MPDNDKIQLPKGFKLDESVETPNVKLPKGFTLDTEVVKKKVGGEESSLTKSQLDLPDFEKGKAFAEKGFLMQAEGTKAPKTEKRLSFEPSLSGIPKVKVLEEGEDPSILADFTSSALKGQIQGKVANILSAGKKPTPEELGEIAQLQTDLQAFPQSKAEKVYQEKGLKGIFKDSPALGVQFVAETITSSLSSLFEASKRTVPTGVAMGAATGAPFAGIGALPGAATGFLASQSAAGYNISTSQDILNSLSENGVDISNKESLINAFSDEKKMAKIRSTAAKYGVPILVFDALTAGFAGKFASGAVGKSLSKKLLAGLGETGLQITGGSGGELAAQVASGKKVNWDDIIIEGIAEVPGGVIEVATGVTMERSKTSSNNKTLATQIATQGVQNGVEDSFINLNRDLANNVITPEQYQEGVSFVEKAAQVVDKIPQKVTGENKVKSIELLVERNDINQANQDLLQQKQTTDVAYHAGIDQEIKANEERIKKLDSEVYNIAKKPSKELAKPVGSEVKITEEEPPIIEEYDLKNGDIITANISGVEEKGKVIGVGKNKGEIVIDFIDENNNERFVYANQVKNIEKGQAEIDNRSVAQKNRLKELLNKEELSREELSELDQLNKAKSEVKQIEQAKEVKPTEVKQPTKELIEGEVIKFKTPQGNTLEGEKVEMEGYEDMDMILVKDGFENRIYELTSGIEIGNTGSAFAKQDAVSALRNQLLEKNVSSEKIKNKLFKDKSLQINPSNKFESYSEQRTTKERADYESLPLKYSPDELSKLKELKKKAIEIGIDKRAKEIDEAIQSRAKEGTYKATPEFFEKMLQKEIDRKIKKEAEDKKTPYPKEFIEKLPEVTEDYLKTMVNSGYKVDKFSKVPQDVKKVMIDGLQLNRDFTNKYGYQPNKESDEFFTKLLYFMNSIGARENKEARANTAKKELVSAFNNLAKVHENEFGKKAEVEVKPNEEVKVYNAKDLKSNPEVLKEDKDYNTLTYPKSFVRLGTNMLALKSAGFENAKIGDVINVFKKDYVIDGFIINKNNPNETKVLLIRVDKDGNLLREQDLSKKEQKEGKAKEFEEEVDLEGTEEAPKKTYQEAVKEKIEADKKQNRQIGAERATVTKEIYRRVDQMDAPEDAEQIALRYLADGGKVSKEAVDEAYGSVKRAQLNTSRRELLSQEVKSKDFVQGNETLDQTAHRLWEQNDQRVSETDIKDRLMAEIGNNNTRLEAAEAYLDKYNAEYKQEKEEMRMAELYKEQYLEEQAEIEKELRTPLDEQIEGEASEEHINNLINQYEAEIKGEDQQFGPAREGDVSKEASKGKVTEKTKETELAKEYKEAVGKASKKAKENAKKEFVDRNFDNIVEKLKIQIKCPT